MTVSVAVALALAVSVLAARPGPSPGVNEREAEVTRVVRVRFERTGRRVPTEEQTLTRAAQALALKALRTSADEAAGLLSVTEAVSNANGWDPSPLVLLIKSPIDELAKAVATQQWADEPVDSMGIGLVVEGQQASLCILFARRRLELKGFVRSFKKPSDAPHRLCATLAEGLGNATLYVTRPKGDVDQFSMTLQHDEWCASVSFTQLGRSVVEVLARSSAGPEVAALFFVDVGTASTEAERTFVEPATAAKARAEIVARVNALRHSQQLTALAADPALDAVAQAYAERMSAEGFFAHVAPDGSDLRKRLTKAGYGYSAAGENLGSSSGPLAAHFGIEHSPGHRKNLLEPGFERLGVGVARRPDGIAVVTEVLATPLNDGADDPIELTYRALAQARTRKKLPALTRSAVLEALATEHANRALKRDTPKVELQGVPPLHDRVFEALDDVKSASVDVYVTESATVAPESKNVNDPINALVGVGLVRGDSVKYGAQKFWVVVIYAHSTASH